MMNFNKLAKNNKIKIVVVIALIAAVVLFADPFGQRMLERTYDINTIGTVKIYEIGDSAVLTSASTVDAAKGMTAVFVPDNMDDISSVSAYIYAYSGYYSYSNSLQKAARSEQSDRFIYTFSLDPLPAGEGQYYIGFSGALTGGDEYTINMVTGHTTYFTVSKSTGSIYEDPVITEGPGNKDVLIGETIKLIWRYEYEGAATLRLYVDGEVKNARSFSGSTVEQVYDYNFIPTSDIDYTVKFEIDPVSSANEVALNTIVINGEADITFADPTIRVGPDDQDALVGEIVRLTWLYTSEGSSVLNLYIDGVLIETENFAGATTERTYMYDFVPEAEEDYTIKFEVVPDSSDNTLVHDAFVVTGKETIDTTTTTTTTTDEPEPEGDIMTILIIGGALVAGVVVLFFVMKKSPFGGGGYNGY